MSNRINVLVTIALFLFFSACTEEKEVVLNPYDIMIGEWEVESEFDWYRGDTLFNSTSDSFIYKFSEDNLLFIRKKVLFFIDNVPTPSEIWYYTHWWIDEEREELLYAEPLSDGEMGTPYNEYLGEYGNLTKFNFEKFSQDELVLERYNFYEYDEQVYSRNYQFIRIQ